MYRAVCCVLLVATAPCVARADDAATVARLKKLMPKDQLAMTERAEEVLETDRRAAAETNGLRRKDLQEKSARAYKELAADLTAKLQTEGLVGWVLECKQVHETGLALSAPGLFGMGMAFDGMAAAMRETCRGLEPGDAVAFTLRPNPRARVASRYATTVLLPFGRADGRAVQSLEKK